MTKDRKGKGGAAKKSRTPKLKKETVKDLDPKERAADARGGAQTVCPGYTASCG